MELNSNTISMLEHYSIFFKCINCDGILNEPDLRKLMEHKLICNKTSIQDNIIIPKLQKEDLGESCFRSEKKFDHEQLCQTNEQNLSQLINCIEQEKNLAKSTIKLYKPIYADILKFLNEKKWQRINSKDLLSYLNQKNMNSNVMNAVKFLISFLDINLESNDQKKIRQISKTKLSRRITKSHKSWKIEQLQQFIDHLIEQRKIVLAFRIYILYYLGARVSELSQISFETIINEEKIQYIPQKQIKSGKNAERSFILSKQVSKTVSRFVELFNINPKNTLNVGQDLQIIKTHSFQIDLQRAKRALSLMVENSKFNDSYINFLEMFTYHDLRYSRLNHMLESGFSKESIRKFVRHKKIATTQYYLRNQDNDVLDFNLNQNEQQDIIGRKNSLQYLKLWNQSDSQIIEDRLID